MQHNNQQKVAVSKQNTKGGKFDEKAATAMKKTAKIAARSCT